MWCYSISSFISIYIISNVQNPIFGWFYFAVSINFAIIHFVLCYTVRTQTSTFDFMKRKRPNQIYKCNDWDWLVFVWLRLHLFEWWCSEWKRENVLLFRGFGQTNSSEQQLKTIKIVVHKSFASSRRSAHFLLSIELKSIRLYSFICFSLVCSLFCVITSMLDARKARKCCVCVRRGFILF